MASQIMTTTEIPMIDPRIFDQLRPRLRGSVLLPSDPGYDDARSIWNAMIDRRPAAIARCLGAADVVAAVRFARDHTLPLCIKGGGHNIAGLAVADDALMLDLSLMRGVWVDAGARIARAQAGCLLGDVDRECQLHGLAAVLGFVSSTGIAGLTLGGGFGYLTRRFGWTSDTLRSVELVTADGRVVRASEKENADLFWGIRGGGGNFGVVTAFEYSLFPVGPEIVGGAIAWRAEDAPEVLEMYRSVMERASPELSCAVILRRAPAAPWLPREVHGTPVIVLAVCHSGALDVAEREVRPITSFGRPVGDVVQRRPYIGQQSLIDATQPKGRRYYWKSEYLPSLGSDVFVKAVDHLRHITSPHSGVILFPIGEAVGRLPWDHSAAGNRDATFVLNIAASWETADRDAENIEWARSAWRDMRQFSTGGTYINFLTEEEGDDRVRAAYGDNLERLVEVKTQWDPENVFRANKNIAPRMNAMAVEQ
jgi:FAD/FMN-containing dehydrogenase